MASQNADWLFDMTEESDYFFPTGCSTYDGRRKTETGKPAPILEPVLLRRFHRTLHENQKNLTPIYKTSIDNKAVISTSSIHDLKRTRIRKLLINVPAKGFYILARTIEPPVIVFGMSTIIEDHTGDVFVLSLYNFLDPDSSLSPEDVLPVGTTLILKEPLLKTAVKGFTIRCDSPTDIIILHKHSKQYRLAERIVWINDIVKKEIKDPTTKKQWKNLGNKMFQSGVYSKAVDSYLMALKLTEEDDIVMNTMLHSNISMAYLKQECYEQALSCAKYVLERDPKHTKALYRAGRAHYELRQYAEAKPFLEEVARQEPENNEHLSRCVSRLNEQQGDIDINKLFMASSENPRTEIDCADYTGPVKIAPIPGKRKGVVATEDIKPGTLLCVSKAIKTSLMSPSCLVTLQKTEGQNQMLDAVSMELVSKLVQCVTKNPNVFGKLIYGLPTTSCRKKVKSFCNEKTREEPIADVQRLRDIVTSNIFSLKNLTTCSGSGIFLLPSYMNHSCLFNASWQVYNDVMVVHAVKEIGCGEEVCISYIDHFPLFLVREAQLRQRNIQCDCYLCELDCKEDYDFHIRRCSLLNQIESLLSEKVKHPSQLSTALTHQVQRMIVEMEGTYKASRREQLKTSLYLPNLYLTCSHLDKFDLHLVMEQLEKALNSIGLTSQDLIQFAEENKSFGKSSLVTLEVLFLIKNVAKSFGVSGKPFYCYKWVKILFVLCEKFSGINEESARQKYLFGLTKLRVWSFGEEDPGSLFC